MAEYAGPFENTDTTETDYYLLAREWQDTGVVDEGDLAVTADGGGMYVRVAAGMAIVRGAYYRSTDPQQVTIAPAGAAPRTDLVVLRFDPAGNSATVMVVSALTQTTTGVYDMPLAAVTVGANVLTIAPGVVVSLRPRVGGRIVPWTQVTRPASARRWQVGVNETSGRAEVWNGSDWVGFGALLNAADLNTGGAATLDGRRITDSDNAPTDGVGANGDIWLEY